MRHAAFAVVMVAAVLGERPAEACICLPSDSVVMPADGALNVPTNPLFVVLTADEQTPRVTVRTDAGTVLSPELGRLWGDDRIGVMWIGRLAQDLLPNTPHTVSYRGETTFTTGGGRDDTPPSAAGLVGFEPEVMPWSPKVCGDACTRTFEGNLSRFRLTYERPADVAFATVEMYAQGDPRKFRTRLQTGYVGGDFCDTPVPPIGPEGAYCARAIVYDEAGNEAIGDEVCTVPARCATEQDPVATCAPRATCTAPSGGGCAASGEPGWLVLALFAFSRGWSRRSARRRRTRAPRRAP